jgi:hypothetical protein
MLPQRRRTEVPRLAITAGVALAALFVFAPSASAGLTNCSVPAQKPTIAAAMADSVSCGQINLAPGSYNEDVNVTRNVVIAGPSEDEGVAIIDGTGAQATIRDAGVAAHDWDLTNVTVTGGTDGVELLQGDIALLRRVKVESNAERGLIASGNADVTLDNTTISGHISAAPGAGISVGTATVELDESTVTGNETTAAPGTGGGINVASTGSLEVNQSSIADNKANGAGGSSGGGINSVGSLTVTNSSITGNQTLGTSGFGAGLRPTGAGTVEITNSTIAGNQATASGAGIWAQEDVELLHTTVAGNTVSGAGLGVGLAVAGGNNISLENTIVADNTNSIGNVENCGTPAGSFQSQGNNIDSQATSGCGFVDGMFADQVGVDPDLAPLADESVETDTLTMAIDDTSPAFDAAVDCEPEDQRTAPRSTPNCDVGAYELHECKGLNADQWGTEGDDGELEGNDDANVIVGFGGVDHIFGDEGADVICGDDGEDRILGEEGADDVKGGAGDDEIQGNDGKDVLKGEDGHDDIKGGDGKDKLKGGDGKDVLNGQGGNDSCNGQGGGDKEKKCE